MPRCFATLALSVLALLAPTVGAQTAVGVVADPCAAPLPAADDWPRLCRYRAENRALTHPPRVVFLGDSITEMWIGADPGLFSSEVVDRGIGGQTTPQMLLRFFADVIDLHPQVVHILAGTNDIAGNTGPSTELDYRHNIEAMVELAERHTIRVVLGSIPPAATLPWRPDVHAAETIRAFNAWLKDYARAHGVTYVDYYGALTDGAGGLRKELSADGVHPNPAGYAVMRPLAVAAIR